MIAVSWFVMVGLLVAAALNVWRGFQDHRKGAGAAGDEGVRELRALWLKVAGIAVGVVAAIAFVFVYNDLKRDACLDEGRSYETGLFVRCD